MYEFTISDCGDGDAFLNLYVDGHFECLSLVYRVFPWQKAFGITFEQKVEKAAAKLLKRYERKAQRASSIKQLEDTVNREYGHDRNEG